MNLDILLMLMSAHALYLSRERKWDGVCLEVSAFVCVWLWLGGWLYHVVAGILAHSKPHSVCLCCCSLIDWSTNLVYWPWKLLMDWSTDGAYCPSSSWYKKKHGQHFIATPVISRTDILLHICLGRTDVHTAAAFISDRKIKTDVGADSPARQLQTVRLTWACKTSVKEMCFEVAFKHSNTSLAIPTTSLKWQFFWQHVQCEWIYWIFLIVS